jgi:outer membrane PBP1 activator LpoA protein
MNNLMAKTNHLKRSVPRLLTPIALAIALAACSSTPQQQLNVDITRSPTQSVEEYMLQADTSQGELKNDWLVMALKSAIKENDIGKANLLLFKLTKSTLNDSQLAEWQLARARLLINRGEEITALKQFTFEPWWKLPDIQWLKFYQTRADIFAGLERWLEATRSLIEVYKLSDESERAAYSEQIWDSISHYNQAELKQLKIDSDETQLRGWVGLAIYIKTLDTDFSQLKKIIERWMTDNPDHPAAIYTPKSIKSLLAMQVTTPQHAALLLPLSGKFAQQAEIIRDGFMFAMVNDKGRNPNATLQVIDTNAQALSSIVTALTNSNTDFIVGPLVKDNILQLKQTMREQGRPIPMLALNIPDYIDSTPNTCYFALSPEQEAGQTAKYFANQQFQFPMIIAPSGSYGTRVVEAFETEWAKHSEHSVSVSYVESKTRMQRDINNVFGLQDSQQNIAQMQSILGIGLESQPRSRRDVDAIYIVADNSDLTLIKPFIEVAVNPEAVKPKLYSSSRSNTGEEQYEDLSGVMYSDIPLLISPDFRIKEQMAAIWPNASNAETRLRAMGMDAYSLLNELPQMKAVNGYEIAGQTGVLGIDEQCVIQRKLNWAEHGAR